MTADASDHAAPVRLRIAPSPTGDPHVGTAYIALFDMAFAHRHGGQFVLRIEDTDRERSSEAAVAAIIDGLTWLGQTQRSTQAALGLRVEIQHPTEFGWIKPRARIEYRHEFESDRDVTVVYADQLATGSAVNWAVAGLTPGLEGNDDRNQFAQLASLTPSLRANPVIELGAAGIVCSYRRWRFLAAPR